MVPTELPHKSQLREMISLKGQGHNYLFGGGGAWGTFAKFSREHVSGTDPVPLTLY